MQDQNAHRHLKEEYEDKSKRLRKQDRYLLSIAGVLGTAATLRAFATEGVSITAMALLGGATLLAVLGLIRFLSGGRSAFNNTKTVIVLLAGVHIVFMRTIPTSWRGIRGEQYSISIPRARSCFVRCCELWDRPAH